MCAVHISDKRLTSTIYKELVLINKEKKVTEFKNTNLSRHYVREHIKDQ